MTNAINPIDILREAREFAQGPSQTDFLVVRKSGSSSNVGKLNIGALEQNELDEIVIDELTRLTDGLRNGAIQSRRLDVVNTISSESIIQYTEADNLPDSHLFNLLTTRAEFDTTSYTEEPAPNFQLIRMSEPGGPLLIGVQNSQNATLIETTTSLALLFSGEEYELFEGEMVLIRRNLNAFYFDGIVFVITPKSFESMFELRDEYERTARAALSEYESRGIAFQEPDKVREWLLSHINMLRELYEISVNGLPERTEPDAIIDVIESYELDIEYDRSNGDILLDIDDYVDTWQLLRLLGAKYAEADEMGTRWEIDQGRRL